MSECVCVLCVLVRFACLSMRTCIYVRDVCGSMGMCVLGGFRCVLGDGVCVYVFVLRAG